MSYTQNSLYTLMGDTLILKGPGESKYKLKLVNYRCEVLIIANHIITSGGIKDNILSEKVLSYALPELYVSETPTEVVPTAISAMKQPRVNHTQCLYSNELYIIGGSTPKRLTTSCERLKLSTSESSNLKSLPYGLMLHSCAAVSDRIYLHGGIKNTVAGVEPHSQTIYLDILTETWVETKLKSQTVMRPCLIPITADYIFVFGGWAKDSHIVNKTHVISTSLCKSIQISEFNHGEIFSSYTVDKKFIKLYDTVCKTHTIYFSSLLKAVEYRFKYKKTWKNRRALVFAHKALKGSLVLFSIPLFIFIEIVRYL
jgi:hypothetical protein